MIEKKGILVPISTNKDSIVVQTPGQPDPVRTNSAKIITKQEDISQWGRLTKALDEAKMPVKYHAVKAAEYRGDQVEEFDFNASMKPNWSPNVAGELIEGPHEIIYWRRGEKVSIIDQLPTTGGNRPSNIIPFQAQAVSPLNQDQYKEVNTIEGVGIFTPESPSLESNPYLNTPANITPIRPQVTENPDKQEAA